MAEIISVAEVRSIVKTSLEDWTIERIISRVQSEIERRLGAAQDDDLSVSVTEKIRGGVQNVFLKRPISSITTVTEDSVSLTEDTDFRVWESQAILQKLPAGGIWGSVIEVVYIPVNQTPEWQAAVIDIVRLVSERTAMTRASGDGFSFSAPDWDAEIAKRVRKLIGTYF